MIVAAFIFLTIGFVSGLLGFKFLGAAPSGAILRFLWFVSLTMFVGLTLYGLSHST